MTQTQQTHWNDRIKALHAQKLVFNDEKLKRTGGFYNIDDHGWIPLDPLHPMEIHKDEKSGLCTGMDALSRTFASYLDSHPPYVNPDSACGGAWIGPFRARDGWRPEERWPEHEALLKKYNVVSRGIYGMNHSGPDMRIGLELGWGGLLEKIRRFRVLNTEASHEFYDGEERVVMALQRLIARTAAHARALAEGMADSMESGGVGAGVGAGGDAGADASTGGWYRQNLLDIAAMNEYLVDGPPRTLREAVQWIVWFEAMDRMYYTGGAGQAIDELLRSYYEQDKRNGLIADDDEAVWYFASLFYGDTHYHQIDGPNPITGESLCSPLSFLVLEAQHRLKIPCNLGLRVHDKTNDELFSRAVQYLFEDGTGVCYSLSGGLDKGFVRNGFPLNVARMRAKVGCNWTALPGTEYALQDVTRICLGQPFLFALREMVEAAGEENTMENLYARFEGHLSVIVQAIKNGVDWHVEHKWKNRPELVLNLVMHGPIERGVDMSAGGVDVYNFACDAVAFATVANSFAAVEQRVVKEGKLGWEQLLLVLDANFEGYEDVRMMLKSVPQFGAGGTRADYWAERIEKTYTGLMRGTTSKNGFTVLPGIFSHGDVYKHGENLPAMPNGRRAGEPISHSADPDPGFLPGGGTAPTAKANAVARVQSGWGNSTPLQVDIDAGMAKERGGVDNIKAFIRAHNNMGGTLLNINVIDKQKILEAHKNPDLYPDLVVRVTGYSAFFKSLSPEYRQQVVDRWLGEAGDAPN
ncbi:MAG: pyruvate-formate lyase [Oscillospiraceae bacterium]|nr:pyruvate-formate lyase [Oscillospiraceae bacterium]